MKIQNLIPDPPTEYQKLQGIILQKIIGKHTIYMHALEFYIIMSHLEEM